MRPRNEAVPRVVPRAKCTTRSLLESAPLRAGCCFSWDAIGGSTPRKSVTQWLWEARHSKRAISDLGGWRSKKEGVDYYFTTSRVQMLTIKANLNPAAPLHPDRPW
jgi:hypothetical protein